jgi:hypothetical protein
MPIPLSEGIVLAACGVAKEGRAAREPRDRLTNATRHGGHCMKLDQVAPVFTGRYDSPRGNGTRVTPSDDTRREKRQQQHPQKEEPSAPQQLHQEGELGADTAPGAAPHTPHLDITA